MFWPCPVSQGADLRVLGSCELNLRTRRGPPPDALSPCTSPATDRGDNGAVTGRPPASFEAFARRNAAAWTIPEGK
jgi:hypothetical protein